MHIVLTFMNRKGKSDFQVNDEMKICDALKIINENSDFRIGEICKFIYSTRKQKNISVNYTFKEAEIFSGDCLKI
ncbi:hypothetical protein NRP93_000957 [Clostridium botulinum]|nr:hypothetical protein [Clostridium botulinum]